MAVAGKIKILSSVNERSWSCGCATGMPFDEFVTRLKLPLTEAERFYDHVRACGGSSTTDLGTLDTLYGIWKTMKHA